MNPADNFFAFFRDWVRVVPPSGVSGLAYRRPPIQCLSFIYSYGPPFGCSRKTIHMALGLSVVSVNPEWVPLSTTQARTYLDASPISGEIDIIEARGNGRAYPAQ
jgi:hypothetical protein